MQKIKYFQTCLKYNNVELGCKLFFLNFFNVYLLLREKERGKEPGEGRRKRERERIPGRFRVVSPEPEAGLEPTNREIMTWAQVQCLTDWATQAPHRWWLLNSLFRSGTQRPHACCPAGSSVTLAACLIARANVYSWSQCSQIAPRTKSSRVRT